MKESKYLDSINKSKLEKKDQTKMYYVIALFADGTYRENYNTLDGNIEWYDRYKISYRLVIWED